MIEYGHFIGGKHVAGKSGRTADVFQPMDGTVRAHVALGLQGRGPRRGRERQGRAVGWAATNPQRRARVLMKFHDLIVKNNDELADILAREHGKTDRRRQGRHPARRRSGRIRARRPASDEGRIYRRRRPRHRYLFDAPAARRRCRHHAVQLPGDDPVMEARAGDRLRQRLHPEAVGARSRRADASRRTVRRGGRASRHAQRRQRRQGSGRRDPR